MTIDVILEKSQLDIQRCDYQAEELGIHVTDITICYNIFFLNQFGVWLLSIVQDIIELVVIIFSSLSHALFSSGKECNSMPKANSVYKLNYACAPTQFSLRHTSIQSLYLDPATKPTSTSYFFLKAMGLLHTATGNVADTLKLYTKEESILL
jgi:hypothetical protein